MQKIVLRAHNIEHLIWERIARNCSNPLKKCYLGHLSRTLKKFERSVPSMVDGIAAITGKDADFFKSLLLKPPSSLFPSGSILPIIPSPSGQLKSYHIYYRAMNWIPNQEGVRWFLDNVWPDLFRHYPGLRFHIAGGKCRHG